MIRKTPSAGFKNGFFVALLSVMMAGTALSTSAFAEDPQDKVVATINGQEITERELALD